MTPTLTQLLFGQAASIAAPQPPEAGADYVASRLGTVAVLAMLAAQEAERGPAARMWENGAMLSLFAAATAYDQALDGALSAAGAAPRGDNTWSGLDHANAELRRVLIRLHTYVEACGDAALDRDILQFYKDMAQARRLDLPGALA
jgi:hypothetical protein